MAARQRVLAVDVGGSHVKLLLQGEVEPRKFESGPTMTPREMVDKVLATAEDWSWDVASIGIPMPVRRDRPVLEPANLGKGWVDFDFERALGRPTKVVNDAVMQALGSYDGGRMLFIGLGTGLGSALVTNGVAQPLELAHLPFRDGDVRGLRRRALARAARQEEVAQARVRSRRACWRGRCSPTTS